MTSTRTESPTLRAFAEHQIAFVEEAARKAWRLLELKPTFDMERWFADASQRLPLLRGVSFREFAAEVMTPGSFRRLQLGEVRS